MHPQVALVVAAMFGVRERIQLLDRCLISKRLSEQICDSQDVYMPRLARARLQSEGSSESRPESRPIPKPEALQKSRCMTDTGPRPELTVVIVMPAL